MATQSKLRDRLRRALDSAHPSPQLDDTVVEYFAGMLEGEDVSELRPDDLAEHWAPYLCCGYDEAATRELCRMVLQRLLSNGSGWRSSLSSTTTSFSLSRESSDAPSPPVKAVGVEEPSSGASPVLEPEGGEAIGCGTTQVRGLAEWLERLCLTHYADRAKEWCVGMGAADVEEVIESWEEFSSELGLRPLECKRVHKDCAPRLLGAGGRSSHGHSTLEETGSLVRPLAPEGSAGTAPRGSMPEEEKRAERHEETAVEAADAQQEEDGARQDTNQEAVELHSPRQARPGGARTGEVFGHPNTPYKILKEIGSGVTATVYKCSNPKGEVFAVKVIDVSRFRMHRDFPRILDRLHRETATLFSLRHSNIVSLYEVLDKIDAPYKLYLVMELVEGGELFSEILHGGPLPEHEARYVFLQIVLGLRYIHSKGFAHRDLKPENVLIDLKESRPGLREVKISDFGHSKLVDDGYSTALSRVGTPTYWAPEVADTRTCERGYDERVDLWSLGVVLYVMLEGRYPSNAFEGIKFRSDTKLSQEAKHLMRSLMQLRPEDRMPLDQCLRHPWVMRWDGPLWRVVCLCEDLERRRRGECERRVSLPSDPCNVRQLRRDLHNLTTRFKRAVTLRRREVAVDFSDGDISEDAWDELMCTLEKHFPDGTFSRPDVGSLESIFVGGSLAPVAESTAREGTAGDASTREPSSTPVATAAASVADDDEEVPLDVELARQDDEIEAAIAAFPDCVEAPLGNAAVVPRRVRLRFRGTGPWQQGSSRVLELELRMPRGHPERCPLYLSSLSLRVTKGTSVPQGSEGIMRARVSAYLEDLSAPGQGVASLRDTVATLSEKVARDLSALDLRATAITVTALNGPVAPPGGGLPPWRPPPALPGPVLPPAPGPPVPAGPLASDAGAPSNDLGSPGRPSVTGGCRSEGLVVCKRFCLLVKFHDDQIDTKGLPEARPRGQQLKKPRQSFCAQLRRAFPEVSGFLSFGRPAMLFAEGPEKEVQKLRDEVDKFPWWRDVQERARDASEPLGGQDVQRWRVFDGFSKVKTTDLQETSMRMAFNRAGFLDLYEAVVGSMVDAASARKRNSRGRGR